MEDESGVYINWIDYWERRGKRREGDLKKMSGYDHKLARLPESSLKRLVSSIVEKLEITENDRILDVGCGAGVITTPLSIYASETVGVDASFSMIQHVTKRIKKVVGEANRLPFIDCEFDKILCHSIFQYFPSLDYARKVTQEMYRVCKNNGIIFIVDIPDRKKREAYLRVKQPNDHNLKRLFYTKEFFWDLFPDATVFNHELEGYENAKYRFNVVIRKH